MPPTAARPLAISAHASSGNRFLDTLEPVQVRRVLCLQLNYIRMLNSSIEKLEHLQKHITQEFAWIIHRVN